jgi:hypothetical protein
MIEDDMASRLQQVLSLCWQSPVFGDSFKYSLAEADFERRMEESAELFAVPFAPIIGEAMPDIPQEIRDAFVHRTKFWVAWLMTIDMQLTDTERLTAAAICLGLLGWGDTFMDRGDAATEAAVRLMLEEHGALPSMALADGQPAIEPERSGQQQFGVASLPVSDSPAVQSRLAALRRLVPEIAYLSHPEDASILLPAPCLNFLGHSLALRWLSQQYLQDESKAFWEKHAYACAKHSILNIQIVGMCGLYYTLYRHENPSLPSLATIKQEPQLMRFLDRLSNAAIRVFDDVGDQKVDAGSTRWNEFTLNLFNIRDPNYIRAFFRFAGVEDEQQISLAIEALQSHTRDGDVAIVRLFVNLLHEELEALPKDILQRYSTFIEVAKRFIETGYANAMGDPSFY